MARPPSPTPMLWAWFAALVAAAPAALAAGPPDAAPKHGCVGHGDLDQNGLVSAGDAQTTFLIALGMLSPTVSQMCAADCNGDNLVSAADAQLVFLAAVGVGRCPFELPAGHGCDEPVDCASGHCQNGFCCTAGDCCARAVHCPAAYTEPPACSEPDTCQGQRRVATCVAAQCGQSAPVADDSACGAGLLIDPCGPYRAATCSGAVEQQPPQCATACSDDAACDPNAHCAGGQCRYSAALGTHWTPAAAGHELRSVGAAALAFTFGQPLAGGAAGAGLNVQFGIQPIARAQQPEGDKAP